MKVNIRDYDTVITDVYAEDRLPSVPPPFKKSSHSATTLRGDIEDTGRELRDYSSHTLTPTSGRVRYQPLINDL